jgi:hypothetical protein
MTPEEWARLTPQQQAAHVSRYGPPPPAFVTAAGYALATAALVAARRSNTCAIVALSVGIVAGTVGDGTFLTGTSARLVCRRYCRVNPSRSTQRLAHDGSAGPSHADQGPSYVVRPSMAIGIMQRQEAAAPSARADPRRRRWGGNGATWYLSIVCWIRQQQRWARMSTDQMQ